MPKKRPRPYKEGVLKEIYQYFIKPLLYLKPFNVHLQDWLEQVFCVEDRTIVRYRAKRKFKIPGLLWLSTNNLVEGTMNRHVTANTEVWIRKDVTMPDRIDVEIFGGRGEKKQVFILTRSQHDSIVEYLELWPFRKNKRAKYSWEKV